MRNSWTESELEQLELQVSEFERLAFDEKFATTGDRKKAIKVAAHAPNDGNMQYILGSSIDYLSLRPGLVRSAISKARDHIETLRANGPRLN